MILNIYSQENITADDTGFFNFLGSLTNRITKLFVQDIDVSGNVNVTGNVTTGKIQGNYFSEDNSEGITNTANYHVCTGWAGASCSSWCTLRIKNGLIVGCA